MKNTGMKHALLAASLAIVLVALGCGRQETKSKTVSASKDGVEGTKMASSQTGGPRDDDGTALSTQTPQAETETPLNGEGTVTPAVSEPPEVVASFSDSLIVPGAVVQVTAHTSSDAVAVTLNDGLGKPKPLTYDAASGQWTAMYRVPLRAAKERVGLSITATNAQRQWSRVWLFAQSHAVEVAAESESTETEETTGQ